MKIAFSIRNKILLFWISSILVTLFLVAGLFHQLHSNREARESLNKIEAAFSVLNVEILSRMDVLRKNTKIIANRKDVISSTYMIGTYQDIKNYKPKIFDAEKQRLAYELSKQAQAGGLDGVMVHDKSSFLASFYFSDKGADVQVGYQSFQNEKPILYAALRDHTDFKRLKNPPPFLKGMIKTINNKETHIKYQSATQALVLESHTPVILQTTGRPDMDVGLVHGISILDDAFIKHISDSVNLDFTVFLPDGSHLGDIESVSFGTDLSKIPVIASRKSVGKGFQNISNDNFIRGIARLPMDDGQSALFVFSKGKAADVSGLTAFEQAIYGALMLVGFTFVPGAAIYLNHIFTKPIKNLLLGVQNLRNGEYQELPGFSGADELSTLAHSFNSMSQAIQSREKELRESEDKFRSTFEQAAVGIAHVAPDGTWLRVNHRLCDILGYSHDEMQRLTFQNITYPADLDADLEHVTRLLNGEGSTYSMEKRYIHKDGSIVWVNLTVSLIRDALEKPKHFVSVIEDITEHKQLEQALRQAQKMDAVGQLTGGIAHDFNNMLGIIMGNLDLLRHRVGEDPKAIKYLENAYTGVTRGAKITSKLLSFSRHHSDSQTLVAVNKLIVDMKDLIAKSLTPKITLKTHLADDICTVSIDQGDFEDALLNLALNAGDAMPDGGTLVIETSKKSLDEQYVKLNPEFAVGDYVLVSISDTGTGMAPGVLEQAFDPFFTTKEEGKGTGLGLSMVYGFTQRSKGHLKTYSEPEKGTTVNLYLPQAEPSGDDVETGPNAASDLTGGDETILVVDDEQGLVDVAVAYLEDLGYTTLVANSAKQALEVLQEHPEINLLFSDVVMPSKMDGYDLAKETMHLYPAVKVLLTSGFTAKREGAVNGDIPLFKKLSDELLNKPYNKTELARTVRNTLDKEG